MWCPFRVTIQIRHSTKILAWETTKKKLKIFLRKCHQLLCVHSLSPKWPAHNKIFNRKIKRKQVLPSKGCGADVARYPPYPILVLLFSVKVNLFPAQGETQIKINHAFIIFTHHKLVFISWDNLKHTHMPVLVNQFRRLRLRL